MVGPVSDGFVVAARFTLGRLEFAHWAPAGEVGKDRFEDVLKTGLGDFTLGLVDFASV